MPNADRSGYACRKCRKNEQERKMWAMFHLSDLRRHLLIFLTDRTKCKHLDH
jgi:hypothetical protein